MYAVSPLRYPGAKWRLERFFVALLTENDLLGGHYMEPYAGGASLALSLLFGHHVSHIHLNDLDRSVYAFWKAVTTSPKDLIDLVRGTPVTMESWYAQQEVQERKQRASIIELGFSTFFLNRTNRSGILTGGVIGGKKQGGKWKIDARYNTDNLIKRLQRIADYRSQIHVTGMDAITFLRRRNCSAPERSVLYLDPPYFVKGQGLYLNAYCPEDHAAVAKIVVNELKIPWVVSYDDVSEIRALYCSEHTAAYELRYSAGSVRKGKEIIFSSPTIRTQSDLLKKA